MSLLNSIQIPSREPYLSKSDNPRIGIVSPCYGLEKVSYALQPKNYEFYKLRTLPWQKLSSKSNYFDNTRVVLPTRSDLIHTFNKIPLNGPKYIVSFELEFPRYFGEVSERQLNISKKSLRSKKCAALLGLSDIAAKQAKEKFEAEGEHEIANKIAVFRGGIYGSQSINLENKPDITKPLKLLFVGNDYLRKGLVACGIAIGRLLDRGMELEINIISNLDSSSYVASKSHKTDAILQSFFEREQVHHLGSVPNSEVKTYMEQSDALLFPTLDESLGWVPIEAGMVGTPTLAADIYAINEFVDHEETGFLLDVPLNAETRRWEGINHSKAQELFMQAQETLALELEKNIEHCIENRDQLQQLGFNAHRKMMDMYSTENAAKELDSIYKKYL